MQAICDKMCLKGMICKGFFLEPKILISYSLQRTIYIHTKIYITSSGAISNPSHLQLHRPSLHLGLALRIDRRSFSPDGRLLLANVLVIAVDGKHFSGDIGTRGLLYMGARCTFLVPPPPPHPHGMVPPIPHSTGSNSSSASTSTT